ncbi:MAG: polysaccharide biosynthesis protein, partial [Oscillospiraceae bacterium]|nr:polysaccharide biosynthesis protein [Oscillospiraceae bacterium]
MTAGTILALVYMAADYALHRAPLRANDRPEARSEILRRLLVLAVPITLSSSMVSVITLIDTSLVQGQLQNALGYTL